MYGVLDVATGEFRHVSAGHPGPLHLPAGGPPVILESPGFPIGLAEEAYDERSRPPGARGTGCTSTPTACPTR